MGFKKILSKLGLRKNNVRNRIKVRAVHGIKLLLDGESLPIVNISQSGLAALVHPSRMIKKSEVIDAQILVDGDVCPITLEVVHVTDRVFGCKILNSSGEFQSFLKQYFYSEIAGMKLEQIDPSRLSPDQNGNPFWYFSDTNHEIYFTEKDKKITSIQITYQSYVVVIGPDDKLSTGVVWEAEFQKEKEYKSSDLVQGNGQIPQDIGENIIRFVGAINNIPRALKEQIEDKLSKKLLRS